MLKSWKCRSFLVILVAVIGVAISSFPVQAAGIDAYVTRYLRATEPVPIVLNDQGEIRLFTPEELTVGKRLFEENCKNCHVGGATLPNPMVSLALSNLKGATPPRINVDRLVAFQRLPMSYDGSEESYWCRQVDQNWLSDEQLQTLAAFILRAAEKAPGWGAETF
jgi:photosystem II cytochrome c550